MSDGDQRLLVHFSERARAGGAFLADALIDVFARRELRTSVMLRGAAGFGAGRQDIDVPAVAIAVDRAPRIAAALEDVRALPRFGGLVTLEDVRKPADGGPVKATIFLGRHERTDDGRPAAAAVVDLLRRHGVAGATVLLGVDGTVGGIRQRARFVGANARVPLMVVAVGDGGPIAAALADLGALVAEPAVTVQPVRILKRDGRAPAALPDANPTDRLKVMVFSSEHPDLLRTLRAAGAAGATSLRGAHGDRLLQLRRHVPSVTTIVDTPQRIAHVFAAIDAATAEAGLVTCEPCTAVAHGATMAP